MSLASSRADSLLGAFDQRGNKVRYASGKPLAKRYISITECGLTEAQKFIKALTTELELGNPEKFAKRQQKRPIGFDFGFPNSANAERNSTASNFSVQSHLDRPFCVTVGLIRIQAHRVLS